MEHSSDHSLVIDGEINQVSKGISLILVLITEPIKTTTKSTTKIRQTS